MLNAYTYIYVNILFHLGTLVILEIKVICNSLITKLHR